MGQLNVVFNCQASKEMHISSSSVFKLDPTNVNVKIIVLAVGLKWIIPRLDQ